MSIKENTNTEKETETQVDSTKGAVTMESDDDNSEQTDKGPSGPDPLNSGYVPIVGVPGDPVLPVTPGAGSTTTFTVSAVDTNVSQSLRNGGSTEPTMAFTLELISASQFHFPGGTRTSINKEPYPFLHSFTSTPVVVNPNQQVSFSFQTNKDYPGMNPIKDPFPAEFVITLRITIDGNVTHRIISFRRDK